MLRHAYCLANGLRVEPTQLLTKGDAAFCMAVAGCALEGPADNIIDETDAPTAGWGFRWTRPRSMRALRRRHARFARFLAICTIS